MPIPAPVIDQRQTPRARRSHATRRSSWVSAPMRQADRHHQRGDGDDPHDDAVRLTDALTISPTVQPTANATPRKPGDDRRQVREPLAEQRHVHVDHRRGHQQAQRDVDPLQRSRPKSAGRQHRCASAAGRRPGTPRPARRRPRAAPSVARASCGIPATLTSSAAPPSSSSDQTGIADPTARPITVSSPAGSAIGTSTAIAAVRIDERAECPTPHAELGEQPAGGGTEQRSDAPHRRHQRRRPRPQPVRQRGIDHRVAQPGEQAAGDALHHAARPAGTPWSAPAAQPRLPTPNTLRPSR